MPIRINLLAEAQAAEEARRRDPVKLGIWVGVFFVALMLIWAGDLQWEISFAKSQLAASTDEWKKSEPNYNVVTNFYNRKAQIAAKLEALDQLTTNRFLWGPVLNALQYAVVDDVAVTHVVGAQSIFQEDSSFVGSGSSKIMIPAKTVQKLKLTIEARDYNPKAEGYSTYKDALCNSDFFAKALGRKDGFVLDGAIGPTLGDPSEPGKQFQNFTLAAHFPDVKQ